MFFLKPRVLFLSSGDPLRSLLAAGLLRQHVGRRFRAFSAAVRDPSPDADQTLKVLGVDTRVLPVEDLAEVVARRFDYVITLCDCEHESCPPVPIARHELRWSVGEPLRDGRSPEAQRGALLTWRNQIAACVRRFIFHGAELPRRQNRGRLPVGCASVVVAASTRPR